jgi:hypothetical protein
MFSLWWQEKWVRGLVLAISPIGLIDAVYTVLLFQAHGAEFEYNPIVRFALTTYWGAVWIVADIVSFVLFAMIAGSYYLHTRHSIFENHTGWLSGLVGLRVGAALYNVTLFYGNPEPVFWGALAALATYFFSEKLLTRDRDISIKGFKNYCINKYDRVHDHLIIRGINPEIKKDVESLNDDRIEEAPMEIKTAKQVWLKRAGYITLAIATFVSVPFILTEFARATGGLYWSDLFSRTTPWGNPLTASTFIGAFIIILILMGVSIMFLMRAFDETEGAW